MNYESEAFRNDTKVEGRFANYFKVCHNNFEFVLDIDQFYPENEHAQLYTRIVTSSVNIAFFMWNTSDENLGLMLSLWIGRRKFYDAAAFLRFLKLSFES